MDSHRLTQPTSTYLHPQYRKADIFRIRMKLAKTKRKLRPTPRCRLSNADTSPRKLRMAKTKQKVKLTPRRRRPPSTESPLHLLNLPYEVLVMIVESSDLVDRWRIMLLCRQLYSLINDQQLLEGVSRSYDGKAELKFFLQLEKEWDLYSLKYCYPCRKFRTRDFRYWWDVAKREDGEIEESKGRDWFLYTYKEYFACIGYFCHEWPEDSRRCPACEVPDFEWKDGDEKYLEEEEDDDDEDDDDDDDL